VFDTLIGAALGWVAKELPLIRLVLCHVGPREFYIVDFATSNLWCKFQLDLSKEKHNLYAVVVDGNLPLYVCNAPCLNK